MLRSRTLNQPVLNCHFIMKQGFYLLLLVATVALSAKIPQQSQWEDFKIKFGKSYRSLSHEAERRNIFMSTLNEIEEHNALYEQGLSTYFQGVNFYSDWTWDEFQNTILMETRVFENKTVKIHIDYRYKYIYLQILIFFYSTLMLEIRN